MVYRPFRAITIFGEVEGSFCRFQRSIEIFRFGGSQLFGLSVSGLASEWHEFWFCFPTRPITPERRSIYVDLIYTAGPGPLSFSHDSSVEWDQKGVSVDSIYQYEQRRWVRLLVPREKQLVKLVGLRLRASTTLILYCSWLIWWWYKLERHFHGIIGRLGWKWEGKS